MQQTTSSRTRTVTRQSLLALSLTAMTALPIGNSLGAAHAASSSAANKIVSKTFTGSVQQMQQWGPIQVAIVVANKKITKVNVTATAHSGRSVNIQSNAIPILKSETLRAQSAKIDSVSGATDMSDAYVTSLQAAINKARAAKALK